MGIHACINHALVLNVREFKMPRQLTATKTSHEKWIHIFSVSIVIIPTRLPCQMQANSFWSWISINHMEFIKRKKILSLLVYVLHKTWNYAFSRGNRAVGVKKCTKKRDARAKLLFSSVKLFLFLLSRRCRIWNFLLFTIHCDPGRQKRNFLSANWVAPADIIRNVFRLVVSSFVSG